MSQTLYSYGEPYYAAEVRDKAFPAEYDKALALIIDLSFQVGAKGTIPILIGEQNLKIDRNVVKAMAKKLSASNKFYHKRYLAALKKMASVPKASGVDAKVTFTASGMSQSLVNTIIVGLNDSNGMEKVLDMMPSPVWQEILTGRSVNSINVNTAITSRTLLSSFLPLMFSLYGLKPSNVAPNIQITGAILNASRPALDATARKVREKRDKYMASTRVGRIPATNASGKVLKSLYSSVKTLLNAVVANINQDTRDILGPLADAYLAAVKDKKVRQFIDRITSGAQLLSYVPTATAEQFHQLLSQIKYPLFLSDSRALFKSDLTQSLSVSYLTALDDAGKKSFYDPDSKPMKLTEAGRLNKIDRLILTSIGRLTGILRKEYKARNKLVNFTDSNKTKLEPSQYNMFVSEMPVRAIDELYAVVDKMNSVDYDSIKAAADRLVSMHEVNFNTFNNAWKQERSQGRAAAPRGTGRPIA